MTDISCHVRDTSEKPIGDIRGASRSFLSSARSPQPGCHGRARLAPWSLNALGTTLSYYNDAYDSANWCISGSWLSTVATTTYTGSFTYTYRSFIIRLAFRLAHSARLLALAWQTASAAFSSWSELSDLASVDRASRTDRGFPFGGGDGFGKGMIR